MSLLQINKKFLLVVFGVVLATTALVLQLREEETVAEESTIEPIVVETMTPASYQGVNEISLIGSVRAVSEAAITTEQAGRVTSVPVTLGQTVQAGQVIATLENASQRAAVLQAEGIYESALASAAQGDVSVREAQNQLNAANRTAVTVIQNAYTDLNPIILTTVDSFFANPDSSVPGLRIDGKGFTRVLNDERVAYQSLLPEFATLAANTSVERDVSADLAQADAYVARTIVLLDTFISVFQNQNNSSRYSQAELQSFISDFTNKRAILVGIQVAIDNATTQLDSAIENQQRAELSATGSVNSAADAQIKQALGGLRSAQANLAKTIVRSPIAGTINALNIRTGDFVSNQQRVAEVANNQALEIVTSIGDVERSQFVVGDEVTIEGSVPGRVSAIAPAVNAATGKTEMRITAESEMLQNGDTVSLTRIATTSVSNTITVPITAVKFEQTNGSVFSIVDDALVANPVEVGAVRGGSVEILSGIDQDTTIVSDVRGLQPGNVVTVTD